MPRARGRQNLGGGKFGEKIKINKFLNKILTPKQFFHCPGALKFWFAPPGAIYPSYVTDHKGKVFLITIPKRFARKKARDTHDQGSQTVNILYMYICIKLGFRVIFYFILKSTDTFVFKYLKRYIIL